MFEIWDINAAALDLFLSVQSQWHTLVVGGLAAGAVIRRGLDYSALDVVMRRRNLDNALFDDVLAMEDAALAAFSEARN